MFVLSVRPQRFDGVELSGAHGRKNSKEKSHGGGNGNRQDHGRKRGLHGERKGGANNDHQGIGENDADQTAGGGKHGGFGEELHQDVLFSRAKGTAEADLAGAFGDAGEHDIHDDDAADNEKNADQRHGHEGQVASEVVPERHDGIGTQDGEIVGRIVGYVAPSAHEHAGFIFAGQHQFRVGSLHHDGEPVDLRPVPTFLVGAERHHHVIVLRLAKGGAERFGHADHFVGVGIGANHFAEGIDVGEKFGGQFGADENHFGVMLLVGRGEEAALSHVD